MIAGKRKRKGPLGTRSPDFAGFATPKHGALRRTSESCATSTNLSRAMFIGVGKTPDSRMRPTVAVRQESRGMSLLRSLTARLKSRHCPTPDNLAPCTETSA